MKGLFLGDTGRVFCTGFSQSGEREIGIWDIVSIVVVVVGFVNLSVCHRKCIRITK